MRVQSVIPVASAAAPAVPAPARPAQADAQAVRAGGQGEAQPAVAVVAEYPRVLARAGAGGLRECFAGIADPRDRRGVRHALPTILGLCTAAVASGQVLLADITAWIAGAGQDVLVAFGCRRDAEGRYTPPHPDTIERLFALLEAQQLADGVGAWLAARAGVGPVGAPTTGPGRLPAIAVDGKAVRGAVGRGGDADGQVPYLLAAATHGESVVLAERLIGAKTNEVPEFAPLLRGLAQRVGGVGGCVFTMDAAHTVRAHAQLITAELFAHYVMIVKQNTPTLYDKIDALTGRTHRSPTRASTPDTADGTSAPSASSTPPRTSGSPLPRRCSSSSVTPPAPSANAPKAAATTRRCRSDPRSLSSA